MQLGLGWIFVGAYAVENGRLSQIAVLGASSLYECSHAPEPRTHPSRPLDRAVYESDHFTCLLILIILGTANALRPNHRTPYHRSRRTRSPRPTELLRAT